MSVVDFASSQQLTPAATRITPRSPEEINWEMQQVQLGIARRAYELFLARGCEHGHDREDWFPRSTRQKHFWTCEHGLCGTEKAMPVGIQG